MVKVGAHMPIALGFEKVPKLTVEVGGNAFQIFPHSPRTWTAKIPDKKVCNQFKAEMEKYGISFDAAFCHTGYLINLASPREDVWKKSVELFILEGKICQALGIKYLNVHPGSHLGFGIEVGIDNIVKALDLFLQQVKDVFVLLENTSPKGGNIGYNFSQMKSILSKVSDPSRIMLTYDTCHGFDSGYDITNKDGVRKLLDEIDKEVGFWRVKMIHLNDSKAPLGKPMDRHENIGKGTIGIDGFKCFLSFEEIRAIPLILETPQEEDMYRKEIALIKSLVGEMQA
ncbi:deoxyribonuclease IV [Pseudothermotoga thermarum]|uniref:Probable endonuclease 4 n=1 Tax=Pseudothermotoga thermarum DSM 5069 TaxID=688269 RepID=F7YW90_9THEM|nr:deoxyribonuclease IV [Pseudothermotoga thermarum]AEH51862.1 Endonuclease IV [Pseudothermotoga thermarum DSM 5069]